MEENDKRFDLCLFGSQKIMYSNIRQITPRSKFRCSDTTCRAVSITGQQMTQRTNVITIRAPTMTDLLLDIESQQTKKQCWTTITHKVTLDLHGLVNRPTSTRRGGRISLINKQTILQIDRSCFLGSQVLSQTVANLPCLQTYNKNKQPHNSNSNHTTK